MKDELPRSGFGLKQFAPERPRLILGMSSGTSADGLDLALIRVSGQGLDRQVDFIAGEVAELQSTTRAAIRNAVEWNIAEYAQWHFALAAEFGELARAFLSRQGIPLADLNLVGSHGQTIFHHDGDPKHGTLQIADASVLASHLRTPVVADFRWSDLAAGGQGAPISPFADWVLHHSAAPALVILNLGGIANLTLLEGTQPPRAWDSGPANGPLDALIQDRAQDQEFDVDGKKALSGQVLPDLLHAMSQDEFFQRDLPRSTGLERFGKPFLPLLKQLAPGASLEDLLRTCCALAAWAVADSLKTALGTSAEKVSLPIYICGGGSHNPALVLELTRSLPAAEWKKYSELNGNADLREAQAFALLADGCYLGEFCAWPGTTGAQEPIILGKIVPAPI